MAWSYTCNPLLELLLWWQNAHPGCCKWNFIGSFGADGYFPFPLPSLQISPEWMNLGLHSSGRHYCSVELCCAGRRSYVPSLSLHETHRKILVWQFPWRTVARLRWQPWEEPLRTRYKAAFYVLSCVGCFTGEWHSITMQKVSAVQNDWRSNEVTVSWDSQQRLERILHYWCCAS